MGRKMLANISISLDSFFPQERVVSEVSLSWLGKRSSVAARRAFLVRVRSLSSGGKATVSVGAFGEFVAAPVWDRECHRAVHWIQKPTPPEKCLTLTTCFPANWKLSYRANKQGSKRIFFCVSSHYGLKAWKHESIKFLVCKCFKGFNLQMKTGQTPCVSHPLPVQYWGGLCLKSRSLLLPGTQQWFLAEDWILGKINWIYGKTKYNCPSIVARQCLEYVVCTRWYKRALSGWQLHLDFVLTVLSWEVLSPVW